MASEFLSSRREGFPRPPKAHGPCELLRGDSRMELSSAQSSFSPAPPCPFCLELAVPLGDLRPASPGWRLLREAARHHDLKGLPACVLPTWCVICNSDFSVQNHWMSINRGGTLPISFRALAPSSGPGTWKPNRLNRVTDRSQPHGEGRAAGELRTQDPKQVNNFHFF